MPKTNKISLPYRDENTKNWYSNYLSLFETLDTSLYNARSDKNFIISGGGTVSFSISGDTGTLTWTSNINIFDVLTGYNIYIAPGSIALTEGQICYITVVRSPVASTAVTLTVANSLNPLSDDLFVLGTFVNNAFYFKNGKIIENSTSGPILSQKTLSTVSFPLFFQGKPANGAVVFYVPMVENLILPLNLSASMARARVASTGTAVFTIKKTASTIGTVTFTSSVNGVFALSPSVTFGSGDILRIEAPSPQDATLEDIGINILATKS